MSKPKHKVVTFESLAEFLAAADTQGENNKASHYGTDASFHGTATFAEALELARKGWPEGAERISKLRATLDQIVRKTVSAKAAQLHWDITGDFVDIGRALSGEPEAFGTFAEAESASPQARVIKLVGNLSAIGGVKTESIFSAGAAITAAVDILESLGNRVELWLGSGSQRHGDNHCLTVLVKAKEASQPVDLDRISFLLANNATLRRLFFSVEEDLGFGPNISRTCALKVEDDSVVTPEVQQSDCYREQRIARVLQVCESCGISFTAEEREAIVS